MYLTRQRTFWQAQQLHSVLKWACSRKQLAAARHIMAEMTMPDAARRRADLIELLQPVHLGSEATAVMVEVYGWKVVGGLAGCHRRRSKSALCGVRGRDVSRL